MKNYSEFLGNGEFIDASHTAVIEFARKIVATHKIDPKDKIAVAISLYLAVRDGLRYDPHRINLAKDSLKASSVLTRNYGFCIEKAILLAAVARVFDIPSRLGFANVRNHIAVEKLEKILQSDVLVFHGFTELCLGNKWVKATPAFNKDLCLKLGVEVLEFNGRDDSVFQQYAPGGDQFMEYLHDYGSFPDLPYGLMISEWKKHYGHLAGDWHKYFKSVDPDIKFN